MTTNRIRIASPAKINLGLEILGKRADGYHDIRSILVGIDLADDLAFWRAAPGTTPEAIGLPEVPGDQNLIVRALDSIAAEAGIEKQVSWEVDKRIPEASGLGGASSNAAAALLAGATLASRSLSPARLATLAAALGSDVPFFLGPLCATVSGRGEVVDPIHDARFDESVILIVPDIRIPKKTATLYGLVSARDFTQGDRVAATADRLTIGAPVRAEDLVNSFERPLYQLRPDLRAIPERLTSLGFSRFGLSGAGPAHYVLGESRRIDDDLEMIRAALPTSWIVMSTKIRLAPLVASTGEPE